MSVRHTTVGTQHPSESIEVKTCEEGIALEPKYSDAALHAALITPVACSTEVYPQCKIASSRAMELLKHNMYMQLTRTYSRGYDTVIPLQLLTQDKVALAT